MNKGHSPNVSITFGCSTGFRSPYSNSAGISRDSDGPQFCPITAPSTSPPVWLLPYENTCPPPTAEKSVLLYMSVLFDSRIIVLAVEALTPIELLEITQ